MFKSFRIQSTPCYGGLVGSGEPAGVVVGERCKLGAEVAAKAVERRLCRSEAQRFGDGWQLPGRRLGASAEEDEKRAWLMI